MSEENQSSLQRILVALDASPHSQAALDTAARLAVEFQAELQGLFVEDEALVRTAQLPFAKEVRAYTAPPKRLDGPRLARQLRYQAEYAEHTLQRMAEQAEIQCSFEVEEGNVTDELMTAAADVDLVVLGKTSTASSRRRLGATSHALLTRAPGPVLVLRETVPRQQPILVYYDGSKTATAALRWMAQLSARAPDSPLQVVLPDFEEASPERLQDDLRAEYAATDLTMHLYCLSRAELHQLPALAERDGGLVVLPEAAPPFEETTLQQFLYVLDRPLLLMR